jgi:hypothetical protein
MHSFLVLASWPDDMLARVCAAGEVWDPPVVPDGTLPPPSLALVFPVPVPTEAPIPPVPAVAPTPADVPPAETPAPTPTPLSPVETLAPALTPPVDTPALMPPLPTDAPTLTPPTDTPSPAAFTQIGKTESRPKVAPKISLTNFVPP